MNTTAIHTLFLKSSGISTDTRKIFKNCIFFALKGENFNANEFARSALDAGAAYAVIDESPEISDPRFILVSDVLKILQELKPFLLLKIQPVPLPWNPVSSFYCCPKFDSLQVL